MAKKSTDFLLEIGCEELPADYMPNALDLGQPLNSNGLGVSARDVFFMHNIAWSSILCFGTPRRLVLRVKGMKPDVREEIEGPPVSVAFDSTGKPTRAAEAFAEKCGVSLSHIRRKETNRGERLFFKKSTPVEKVLAMAVPRIIQQISFPKTMRWDETGVRFARPVRWLLALYGMKIINCSYGLVKGGRETYSVRRAGVVKKVAVKSSSDYVSVVEKLAVRLEDGGHFEIRPDGIIENLPVERKKSKEIFKQLEAKARTIGGQLADPSSEEMEWLLNTVTFLAEDPFVAVGSFQKTYLNLPPEVLATAMAKHLKLFSIYSKNGKDLLPKFLAVLEGEPKNPALVMANIERILGARFSDARFFYQEDTKKPLEAKIPQLEKVVFHEKLGTVAERIPRLERLMNNIVSQLNLSGEVRMGVSGVASLCKADLVTHMVREFPSLQGMIGSLYAHEDGESEMVSSAIRQQYCPRSASDSVPTTPLGALLGLADRLDTLIGYFGVGLKPTGSLDPYALRRQALGFVRILIEPPKEISFIGLSIDSLFDKSVESWGSRLTMDAKTVKKELRVFMCERFGWLASTRQKIEKELMDAVLAANDDDLAGAWERLMILRRLWSAQAQRNTLVKAAKVAERTGRIVKSDKSTDGLKPVNPEIFKEDSEKKLWDAWNRLAPSMREQIRDRRYEEAVAAYSSLYPQVHEFFEKVFVMDENMEIRGNRLALMNEIYRSLAGTFADLSKLPLAGVESA